MEATSLGDLISQGYTFALSIVGLCVFFMFLYAGLQVMIPGLGGRAAAWKIIKDAVIGTILLFSAYVILYSINHDLVQQTGTVPVNPSAPTGNSVTNGNTSPSTLTPGGGSFGGGGASGTF